MGMFDRLHCAYPLPLAAANGLDYQTKDLVNFLDNYEIREDGSLWHEAYDTADLRTPEAIAAGNLAGILGRVNKRWEPEPLTGEVRFYTLEGELWIEFSAYFVEGQLSELHDLSRSALGGGE